jgi:predicted TIM-barrel fold metal-dependent hydrolase
VIDPYAIRNRDLVGVEQMMWSNDLFHAVNEWPHDWAEIERDFAGVPSDEKELILAGNAVRAYRLGSLTPAVERP